MFLSHIRQIASLVLVAILIPSLPAFAYSLGNDVKFPRFGTLDLPGGTTPAAVPAPAFIPGPTTPIAAEPTTDAANNVANGLGINNGSNPANNLVANSGASLEGALSALATAGPESDDPNKNITLFNVRAGSKISMLIGKETNKLAATKLKDNSLKVTNLTADDQVVLVADITHQQNQTYLDEQVTHNLISNKIKLSPSQLEDMLNSPTLKIPGV